MNDEPRRLVPNEPIPAFVELPEPHLLELDEEPDPFSDDLDSQTRFVPIEKATPDELRLGAEWLRRRALWTRSMADRLERQAHAYEALADGEVRIADE